MKTNRTAKSVGAETLAEVWCHKCERPAEVTIRMSGGETWSVCRRHQHALLYANAR